MAQSSYQKITLTDDIILSWPTSFGGGTVVTDIIDVEPDDDDYTITMPNATLVSNGYTVKFNNISEYDFTLLAYDGLTEIAEVTAGEVVNIYIYDASTSNGLWRVVPDGGGTNGVVSFTAESSDESIDITGGVITPPGGVIDFQLPTSISNIIELDIEGFPVITDTDPLTWTTRELIGGDNITISDGDGVSDSPVINLSANISGVTTLSVGNIDMNGSTIEANISDGDIILNTTGTGVIDLNGVFIDASANVQTNNLTVTGTFDNPTTPKVLFTFTDTIAGDSHVIVIQNKSGISGITGGAGTYTATFSTPLSSTNYGVFFGIASTGDEIPLITHAYWTVRELSSVTFIVTDASGELVSAVPEGMSVMIMLAD
jgi:hypothetical protein